MVRFAAPEERLRSRWKRGKIRTGDHRAQGFWQRSPGAAAPPGPHAWLSRRS